MTKNGPNKKRAIFKSVMKLFSSTLTYLPIFFLNNFSGSVLKKIQCIGIQG